MSYNLSKYISVEVKPTLLAAKQHLGAYADGDVLFDWTEFKLPNGTNRLVGVTAIVRGNDGAAQDCPMDLMFATKTPAGLCIATKYSCSNKTVSGKMNCLDGLTSLGIDMQMRSPPFINVADVAKLSFTVM